MAGSNEDIISFVKNLDKGIKKFGIAKITKHLQALEGNPEDTRHNQIRQRILREIAFVYGITPRIIMTSKKRGPVTQAKVTAIILFQIHLYLTKAKIADIFGYDPPIVSARINAMKNIPCDPDGIPIKESDKGFEKVYSKEFMANFNRINKKITDFKNSI